MIPNWAKRLISTRGSTRSKCYSHHFVMTQNCYVEVFKAYIAQKLKTILDLTFFESLRLRAKTIKTSEKKYFVSPFHVTDIFLYPLKHQKFSDVFKGFRKRPIG